MNGYDPNDVGQNNGNIFSLPHQYDESSIILIPVPWDVTTSYRDGTSNGPQAILEASGQLDFYHKSGAKIWEYGVHLLPIEEEIIAKNKSFRAIAKQHIEALENGNFKADCNVDLERVSVINNACHELKNHVKSKALKLIDDTKLVGLIGGDHGCALGIIEALSERHKSFGILQIDAHADLRETYENFTYSHASIFYNALNIRNIERLSQVGIRDISPNEVSFINNDKRIECFYDWAMKHDIFKGISWQTICDKIVASLPQKVYISFDIDGLNPSLCPNTGTPVPGGLSFEQAVYLIDCVVQSGKQIIGFDLCEVSVGESNSDWDANVGSRILFQLCTALHLSSRN